VLLKKRKKETEMEELQLVGAKISRYYNKMRSCLKFVVLSENVDDENMKILNQNFKIFNFLFQNQFVAAPEYCT
jgi:hypothetical protein